MKSTKKSLIMSTISLVLCFAMLLGTTWAWFTDEVTSGVNKIVAGNLDVELYHATSGAVIADNDHKVTSTTQLFNIEHWEPGVVAYENFMVKNVGNLALKYALNLNVFDKNATSANNDLTEVIKVAVVDGGFNPTGTTPEAKRAEAQNVSEGFQTLADFQKTGNLAAKNDSNTDESTYGIILYWEPTDNDNLYNLKNGLESTDGQPLFVEFGVNLVATQDTVEADSFDTQYDKLAEFPVTAITKVETGKETTLKAYDGNNVLAAKAVIPADAPTLANASKVEMTVDKTNKPTGIVLQTSEKSVSYDVKFFSVASNGDKTQITDFGETVVSVDLSAQIPDGADLMKVYHTHGGTDTELEKITTSAEDVTNGKFYYDATTKILTVGSSTFSPFTFIYKEYVAYIEGKGGYETLGAALSAVRTGETLKLLKNVEYSNTISKACNFTFDLNGKTLDFKGTSTAVFECALNESTWNDYYAVSVKNGTIKSASSESVFGCYGCLTLKNVTIDYTGSDYVIDLKGNNYDFICNATMEDCVINSSGNGVLIHAIKGYTTCQTSLNIKDSTVNVTSSNYAFDCQAGKLTIDSCNITSDGTAIYNVKSVQASGVTSDITIKGDTTISSPSVTSTGMGSGTFAIIEGKYNFDPTSNVDTENYNVEPDGDYWVVATK